MRLLLFFTFLLLISLYAFTYVDLDNKYPKDYFQSPVKATIRLSGTFGELRPNHFHAGIDIKGAVGQSLYAPADGYVSRIKIQKGGYGKVLYIDHPIGYTTVFAHMNKFDPAIEEYVKMVQYQQESFEIELFPPAGQFSFLKGEKIGTMGLTGRSFGPHLHFEVRETSSEKPINPLLFGFFVKDQIAPKLHQLRVYELNTQVETMKARSYSLYKKGSRYGLKGDTVYVNGTRVGLAIKAYDHMDGVPNWNGVYAILLYENDSLQFTTQMEKFSFDESRYINAHLDYEEQVSKKSYFNRCFRLPGNQLSLYTYHPEDGIIELEVRRSKKIDIVVKDVEGNESKMRIWLKSRQESPTDPDRVFNYFLPYNEENVIDKPSIYIHLPEGALYENLYFNYSISTEESSDVYSSVHHLQDYKTPTHKYYDLAIWPNKLPEELRDKAFIAYCNKNNKTINYGGEWEGDKLKTQVRDFGDFCVKVDNIAPTIEVVRFRQNMRGYSKIVFRIRDNFETARNVSGIQYRAAIDGTWVLMEYDEKNDLLTHRFENTLENGEHEFVLDVWDNRGNERTFKKKFLY